MFAERYSRHLIASFLAESLSAVPSWKAWFRVWLSSRMEFSCLSRPSSCLDRLSTSMSLCWTPSRVMLTDLVILSRLDLSDRKLKSRGVNIGSSFILFSISLVSMSLRHVVRIEARARSRAWRSLKSRTGLWTATRSRKLNFNFSSACLPFSIKA